MEFDMREFRFPRFAIFLMLVCLFNVLAAIGLAAEISRTVTYPGAPHLGPIWSFKLPGSFVVAFLMLWTIGAIGYAVVFALRRSGLHRLSRLEVR
jgi:hypothetical protein